MSSVLHAKDLNVGYDRKTIVGDIDINALKGHVICLIGPNGAGKSTILRTLAGLIAPLSGTVYIGQEDIRSANPNDLAKQMAIVLTERLNVSATSAYEIVSMGRIPYTGFLGRLDGEDHRIIRESMQITGATELAGREYTSLSDGEKQKVLIARALAQEPQLIILDEPTSYLDLRHKIEVIRILNTLSSINGMTVILALHDVEIAIKSCQFVLLVKNGRVIAQGRPEDIIGKETIRDLYDIEGAMFNTVMGSLEICNDKPPRVFVASGAGTGTPVFRLLSRLGFGIATGILNKNDIDFHIADSMKLTVIAEPSFEPVSDESRAAAGALVRNADFVIDTNFPVGTYNAGNIELLRAAAGVKPTLSLRPPKEIERLYGNGSSIVSVSSVGQLQEQIAGLGFL